MNDDKKYLEGRENWFIRAYFYLTNGLGIVNEFRNLILGIIGIHIALKLESITWMIVMFIVSVVVLTLVGYYVVHKVSKVKDWLSVRFGSHYNIKNFDYNESSNQLLKDIKDLLKNK